MGDTRMRPERLARHAQIMHRVGMPNSELLTSPQVANALGCSLRTVHRLAAAKQLQPAQKLPGPNGAFLFTEDDVREYQRNRESAA